MMQNEKDRKPGLTGSRSFLRYIYCLAAVFMLAVLGGWYASQLVITLKPENNKTVVITTYPGDQWLIRFTHSVERTPVEEFFTVNGVDDFTMTHTRFESLGWGFPYSPADGKLTETDDGRFDLVMNRNFIKVQLRTAVQARPSVIHDNDIYDLCDLFGQGTLIEIHVQRRYQYWIGEFF